MEGQFKIEFGNNENSVEDKKGEGNEKLFGLDEETLQKLEEDEHLDPHVDRKKW